MTLEIKCTCKGTPAADYQDRIYGSQIRVFNIAYGNKEATCTVCGSKHKIK